MNLQNQNENKKVHEEHINDWEDDKLNLKPKLLRGIYAFGFEK